MLSIFVEAAEEHSVKVLPTFVCMKGKRQIGRVEGAYNDSEQLHVARWGEDASTQ